MNFIKKKIDSISKLDLGLVLPFSILAIVGIAVFYMIATKEPNIGSTITSKKYKGNGDGYFCLDNGNGVLVPNETWKLYQIGDIWEGFE